MNASRNSRLGRPHSEPLSLPKLKAGSALVSEESGTAAGGKGRIRRVDRAMGALKLSEAARADTSPALHGPSKVCYYRRGILS